MFNSFLSVLSIRVYLFILFPACYVNCQEIESAMLQSSSDVDILYHEKSPSLLVDLYSLHHELSGKLNSGNSQFSILWETDRQLYQYKTSKNNLDFQIGTKQNIFSFFWKYRYSDFFIEPGVSVSLSEFGTRVGFGSSLGWQPNETDNFQVSFFNRERSFYHEWNVEDSQAEFNQWSEISELKLSGKYSPIEELSLKSEFRKQFYSVESESEPFSDSSKFENWSYSAEIRFKPTSTLNSWIRYSDFSGNGEPDFRFQKFSFSTIVDGKSDDYSFFSGILIKYNSTWEIGSEYNFRRMSLKSFGFLESFPFTPSVSSILGGYYFFSIDSKVKISEILFSGIYHYGENQNLTIKTGYQLAEPGLFLQTWEPITFLFGRKNEKTTQLDFSRLHVIPLTIGWKFKVNSFKVDLLLNQLIPVYAEKRVTTPTSGKNPNGASSGSSAPQSDRFVWGGTNFKITIGYEI